MDLPELPKAAPATTVPLSSLHYYSETNASIVYAGAWRSASYFRYVGHAAKYATTAGATATFTIPAATT